MSNKVLIKKNYTVDDNNDYILVKEFLILEGEKKNELVLKLVNATNENCRDLKFIVTQLDANGNELEQSTFECRYMKNNANSEFVPKKAMSIRTECVDVIVDLAFASFQTAYYSKGELNPITPNMRHEIDSKDGNRLVKNKYLTKPVLIALVLVVVFSCFVSFLVQSVNSFRDSTIRFYYENVEYRFINRNYNTELEVIGMHEYSSTLTIPDYVGEYKVVAIADNAFKNNAYLNSLNIIGDLKIGKNAFENCHFLMNVNMPNIREIGHGAFYNCTQLQSVTLNNVQMIDTYAFGYCTSLKTFILKNSTKEVTLSPYIFDECRNLETVYIDQDINKVNSYNYIFNNCYNVKNLKIDELGSNTIKQLFGNSVNIRNLCLENVEVGQMTEISKSQFINLTSLKSFKVENLGTGKVGDSAFSGCTNLTTFEVKSGVTNVGANAFYNTKLSAFNFDNVISIGTSAFENSGLQSVDLSKSSIIRLNSSVFKGNAELKSVILNNQITVIGSSAFKNCTSLDDIKLSSRLLSISEYAFENCSALLTLQLPVSLTSIGAKAFINCTSLKDVYIPGSMESISAYTFSNCSNLVNVEIGNGVKVIYAYAFSNCKSLEELIIPSSVTSIDINAFLNATSIKHVTMPYLGTSSDNPKTFKELFNSSSIESINLTNCSSLATYTFDNCSNLEEVTIAGSIVKLPEGTFNGCTSLKSVEYPNEVKRIDAYAFYNCQNLRSIKLSENIEYIGTDAFYQCLRLWEIFNDSSFTIIAGVENYNAGNIGLYTIKVHNSDSSDKVVYETIDDLYYFGFVDGKAYLLEYLAQPTDEETEVNLILPVNFKVDDNIINEYNIHAIAFSQQDINSVKIPEGVTYIGYKAFEDCYNLELVYLPSTLETIHTTAFTGCQKIYDVFNLTNYSLTLGSSDLAGVAANALVIHTTYDDEPLVKHTKEDIEYRLDPNTYIAYAIGFSDTFDTSLQFTTIIYDGDSYNETQIYKNAFKNSFIETVELGNNVSVIGKNAFASCESLKTVTTGSSSKLSYIGDEAFNNCYDLEKFDLSSNAPLRYIGAKAFANSDIEEFTLPYNLSLSNIGSDAFLNCYELTIIYNYTGRGLTVGYPDNGKIAYYAFGVYSSKSSVNIVENGNFKFASKNNVWYLINIDKSEYEDNIINLPDRISSSISQSTKYRVWTKFYTDSTWNYYDLYLPTTVSSIDNGINCSIDDVYFGGSSYQWNTNNYNHSNKFYSASIYYYADCVHDSSTWTYVNGQISTSYTSLNYSVYQEATCHENGINRGYCNSCSYYSDSVIYALGHDFDFSNGICTRCSSERKDLTEDMFLSSLFTNASSTPFTYENGHVKSTNKNTYSSSTITFNSNSSITLKFNYQFILSYGDQVTIAINGVTDRTITYSSYSGSYEVELGYGDRLQITYRRGSYTNTNAYFEFYNMQMIYEK